MRSTSFTLCAFALLAISCEVHGFMDERRGPPALLNIEARNTAKWATVTQRLDHFNPQDNRTYQMRYIFNNELYKEEGPIFILLGGEWTVTANSIEGGHLFDIAKQHNGFLFYTEHRFYGQSHPFSDLSTKNLAYLSIDQALADVAHFIQYARETFDLRKSKVVVAGGSYAGDMATWMRLKYPHLVDAAWASSAPVVAVLDFPIFHQIVGANIKKISPQCYNIIEQASQMVSSLLKTPEGRARISRSFNTCKPVRDEFPYNQLFWSFIAGKMAGIMQYGTPRIIADQCNTIINANASDPMEKLGYWATISFKGVCIPDYDAYINYLASTQITDKATRQWTYQVCSKFGWFQTTTSTDQPFGTNMITPVLNRRMCYDAFGPAFGLSMLDEAVKNTNVQFGGKTTAITKVVSIHGSLDPWYGAGILSDLHEDAPARFVEGTCHCADLASISPSDNEQMIAAKQFIMSTIARWIR